MTAAPYGTATFQAISPASSTAQFLSPNAMTGAMTNPACWTPIPSSTTMSWTPLPINPAGYPKAYTYYIYDSAIQIDAPISPFSVVSGTLTYSASILTSDSDITLSFNVAGTPHISFSTINKAKAGTSVKVYLVAFLGSSMYNPCPYLYQTATVNIILPTLTSTVIPDSYYILGDPAQTIEFQLFTGSLTIAPKFTIIYSSSIPALATVSQTGKITIETSDYKSLGANQVVVTGCF